MKCGTCKSDMELPRRRKADGSCAVCYDRKRRTAPRYKACVECGVKMKPSPLPTCGRDCTDARRHRRRREQNAQAGGSDFTAAILALHEQLERCSVSWEREEIRAQIARLTQKQPTTA